MENYIIRNIAYFCNCYIGNIYQCPVLAFQYVRFYILFGFQKDLIFFFLLKNFLFYTTTKEVVLISLWRGIRRRHWKYLMIERIKMGTFRFSFLWMRAIKVCLLSICIWKKNRIFQSILFFIFLKMYVFQFKWKLGYC